MVSIFCVMLPLGLVDGLDPGPGAGGRLHFPGQVQAALAALVEGIADEGLGFPRQGVLDRELQFLVVVAREIIDGHDQGHAESLHVLDVLVQVVEALDQRLDVLFGQAILAGAAMVLQGPEGRDQHHGVDVELSRLADEIQELLAS